ncbi:hypothetical protein F4801DRAFT_401024 [Xylaria longipes]|nr:hypothetical protein F4801DRAFT_401024 [Xylaria longipes]
MNGTQHTHQPSRVYDLRTVSSQTLIPLCSIFTVLSRKNTPQARLQRPCSNGSTSEHNHDHGRPRFVIGIDYGTTYAGVAWILTTGNTPRLDDINVVANWSPPTGSAANKVPSELTYTRNQGEQWRYGIGEDAYAISWTKMNLEKPSRLQAIETLRQTLESAEQLAFDPRSGSPNQVPHHLIKTPANILTDYLAKVAAVVRRDIKDKRDVLKKFPIDLVITHPAGDCFIVMHAGGGTVDLVSHKVNTISPNFIPTRVTDVSSGRYGAMNIDRYFVKTFLRQRLGENEYEKLLAFGAQRGEYSSGEHTVWRRG